MFSKGVSGNPNGRPRVTNSLSDILRTALDQTGEDGKTHKQAIADRLIDIGRNAKDTDAVAAVKYIFDRLDGSPKQTSEIEVTERKALTYDEAVGAPDNEAS